MITSKAVFAKRKEGNLSEAYSMAIELIKQPYDEWNFKAYAWCLIDIIKREVNEGRFLEAQQFADQLKNIDANALDEVLTKSIDYVMSICKPQMKEVNEAKELSKQGRHEEAAAAYRTALLKFPDDTDINTSLGWELHRIAKPLFAQENIAIYPAKKLLAEYIKLKIERPSLLHSLFLRYADKLAGSGDFNIVAFIKLWDLNNLTEDDFTRYIADDGKEYPALAEKIIQNAAKDSFNKSNVTGAEYILPFLDNAIQRYPDNFWLIFNKAKLLLVAGQTDLAKKIAITVVKNKINDFWAWDLLGDIMLNVDNNKAMSCYCKALLCRSEEKFIGKVRIKLAELLVEKGLYQEAKSEISTAVSAREKVGWEITDQLRQLQSSDWYTCSLAKESNQPYYLNNSYLAEELVYDDVPWSHAIVGEHFTLPNKPNQVKRKIYVALSGCELPIEVSVSDKMHDFKSVGVGKGLKLKCEYDPNGRLQIYKIENRVIDSDWDIFTEHLAVIDHVNQDKQLVHFIVNKQLNGIIRFADLPSKVELGQILAIKVSEYKSSSGVRYSVLSCRHTDQSAVTSVIKEFSEHVRVSNGFGFTDSEIFIDPSMVRKYAIDDGRFVSGKAVLNYDKKKSIWGWKAISLKSVC